MYTENAHLVIGAGPTGLACAKALREAGIPYDHVEATDHVGGNWAHGVYETTHIVSSRRTTQYDDYPMPPDYPAFPSAEQMCDYFEDYADTFGLDEHIRFETEVDSVSYRDDERWDVRFADGSEAIYRGLIVCNGHHWKCCYPGWVDDYDGEVLHSKDYRRPDQLRDKRLLVLGGGNSGCDLIAEAARCGECAHWSLRRGYWFFPEIVAGKPSIELLKPWMPVPLQRLLLRGVIRLIVGRYTDYGLPEPDHRIFEAHPSISSEIFLYLKKGLIDPVGDIARVDGDRVIFEDGREETYDLVVCATGYEVAFPFLPDGMVPVEGKNPQLYAGVVRPEYRHLYIAGAYQARYGIGPLLRPLARLIAEWIELQEQLDVTVGTILDDLGQGPFDSHLVDPHRAVRMMTLGRKLSGGMKWYAKLRGMA